MRAFILASAVLLLSACEAPKIIGFKGTYPKPPFITRSTKSFDQVWNNTVDFFAQHGIPIKIIDKSSGIIVSDKAALTWSFEDKNGHLVNHDAFVVVPKIVNELSGKPYKFSGEVTGEWNIRVKSDSAGCLINVNLYNIQGTYERYYYSYYAHTTIEPVKIQGITTGEFERTLEDAVK